MLNSASHSLEHYCASVRPIALLHSLHSSNNAIWQTFAQAYSLVQYGVQYGFSHVITSKYAGEFENSIILNIGLMSIKCLKW